MMPFLEISLSTGQKRHSIAFMDRYQPGLGHRPYCEGYTLHNLP